MRSFLACLLLIALLAPCTGTPAFAEDDPPGPAPAPAAPATPAVPPPFGLDVMAPAEGALPEGWTAAEAPEGAPTAERLTKLATEHGIPADKVAARSLALERPGEGDAKVRAVLAWLALDAATPELGQALTAASKEGGWTFVAVGTPLRLLASWSSDAAALAPLQAWQSQQTARGLCEKGLATLMSARDQFDPHAQAMAARNGNLMLGAALQLVPDAAWPNAILGQMLEGRNPAEALKRHRMALDPKAPVQPPAEWVGASIFFAGQYLLTQQAPEALDEALALLTRGLAVEAELKEPFQRFGNRYNLGCAYARKGDLDHAFEHVEKSLAALRAAWEEDKKSSFSGMSRLDYPGHYQHCRLIDTDMDPLRKDPRWAPLMARLDPYAAPSKPEAPKKDGGGENDK